MFRWFKERKRRKRVTPSAFEVNRNYSPDADVTSDYGFNDKTDHVYEEIPDRLRDKYAEKTQVSPSSTVSKMNRVLDGVDSGVETEALNSHDDSSDADIPRSPLRDEVYLCPIKSNTFRLSTLQNSMQDARPKLPPRNARMLKRIANDISSYHCGIDSKHLSVRCRRQRGHTTTRRHERFAKRRGKKLCQVYDYVTDDTKESLTETEAEEYKLQLSRVTTNLKLKDDVKRIISGVKGISIDEPQRHDQIFHDVISLTSLSDDQSASSDASNRGTLADVSESESSAYGDSETDGYFKNKMAVATNIPKSVSTKPKTRYTMSNPTVADVRSTTYGGTYQRPDSMRTIPLSRDNGVYSRTYQSNNRLLSDMIRRNNDKQLLMV